MNEQTFEQFLNWIEDLFSHEWRLVCELSIPREKTYARRTLLEWTLLLPPTTDKAKTLVKN